MTKKNRFAQLRAQNAAEEQDAEEMADAVLTPIEAMEADKDGQTAVEYVRDHYDVDPANFKNEHELNQVLAQKAQEGNGSDPSGVLTGSGSLDGKASATPDADSQPEDPRKESIRKELSQMSASERDLIREVLAEMGSGQGVQAAAAGNPDVEEVADAVLTGAEAHKADQLGMSKAQFVQQEYDVDPAKFPNEHALNRAMSKQ
ncbi:hypothetical protein G3I44_10935 [Halogeometricum borinquense]|uniref:Uncharacterized protein n=1 Tax=Halogeometricum borinquense TaxID=60847 RepID=A0A6C0UH45_9EURY|nr:hypothetical protein [Halogeometricum borinquense]QIB74755.1 hypothetical protein G3I44_10935 [Halogeometricum borinquense]